MPENKTVKYMLTGALSGAVAGWLWGVGTAVWVLAYNDALAGPWPTWAVVFGISAPAGAFPAAVLGAVLAVLFARKTDRVLTYLIAFLAAAMIGWIIYVPSVDSHMADWVSIIIRIFAAASAVAVFLAVRKVLISRNMEGRLPSKSIVAIWVVLALLVEAPLAYRAISLSRKNTDANVKLSEAKVTAIAPKFLPLDKFPNRDKDDRGKVFILGMDALTWERMDPLIARGKLPNFEKLKSRSAWGPIETVEPPLSPRLWTTMATGKTPKEHGIEAFTLYHYTFIDRWKKIKFPKEVSFLKDIAKPFYRRAVIPISNSQRKVKALWNIADEAGIGVGVVDWWASWPPERINGFIVTDHAYFDAVANNVSRGWYTRAIRGDLTWPPELYDAIARFSTPLDAATPYRFEDFVDFTDADRTGFKELLQFNPRSRHQNPLRTIVMSVLHDDFYASGALHLIKTKGQPELTMVYLRAVDWISHASWVYAAEDPKNGKVESSFVDRYAGSVEAAYVYADGWLGKFLDAIEPGTTLLVVSDHGFGPDENSKSGYGHNYPYPGAVFVTGPHVKSGVELKGASIEDVAANALTWLGLPIGVDMVGKPWRNIMTDEWLQRHPIRRIKTYEAGVIAGMAGVSAEDKEMVERLKALGYIQ